MHSGEELADWKAHANTIAGLAFTPDSTRIATASHDGTVKLFDASAGRLLRTWSGPRFSKERAELAFSALDPEILSSDNFQSVAFSPDGESLIAGMTSGRIVVWDVASGRERYVVGGHNGWVNSVSYSRDGRSLVSAGTDRLIKLWDAKPAGSCAPYRAMSFRSWTWHSGRTASRSFRRMPAPTSRSGATFPHGGAIATGTQPFPARPSSDSQSKPQRWRSSVKAGALPDCRSIDPPRQAARPPGTMGRGGGRL